MEFYYFYFDFFEMYVGDRVLTPSLVRNWNDFKKKKNKPKICWLIFLSIHYSTYPEMDNELAASLHSCGITFHPLCFNQLSKLF